MLANARFYFWSWAFIVSTLAYDGHFAWVHQAGMVSWELNPLVRWVLLHAQDGIVWILGYKIVSTAYAAVVIQLAWGCRLRIADQATWLLVTGCGALMLLYLFLFLTSPSLGLLPCFHSS